MREIICQMLPELAGSAEHREHPASKSVFHMKHNTFKGGTPGTPGTHALSIDAISAMEERAAIMEFDAADVYPNRQAAEESAYLDYLKK